MTVLTKIERALSAAVTAFLVLTFTIMLGLAAVQVFLRFFFHTGILWGDVAARHLVVWVGFFGAFLAARENKHFRIDVLTRFVPWRFRQWLAAFTDLFAAVISSFLLRASITFVDVGIDPDAVAFFHIPQTAVAWIVPAGFGLLSLEFLLRAAQSVASAIRNVPQEGDA